MSKKSNSAFKMTSTNLIAFAWEKRTQLTVITIIAVIVSTIVSYKITELYKSTVILYPAPAASASKYLLTSAYSGRQTLHEFGEEEQCDQLIQVLSSENIKNRIIEKYNLFTHYEINPDGKYKNFEMNKEFRSKIRFRRTKFVSVSIEVMDKNPEIAAAIANDIADLVDSTMNDIHRERTMSGYKAVEKEYFTAVKQIQQMEDSLRVLQKMGILNIEYQTKELTLAYATALIEGKESVARVIDSKLKLLEKHAGTFNSLTQILTTEYSRLVVLRTRYTEAKVDAEQVLSYKYIVDNAVPADKKSYPKKSLIILQVTISAFVFAYILLLLISVIRTNKKIAK